MKVLAAAVDEGGGCTAVGDAAAYGG